MDADRRVRSLICISRLSGRRRTAAEDIDRRATVVRAACPATVARMERLAMAEVEDARRAVAEAVTSVAEAVEGDTRAEVAAVVTAPAEAGAATEAADTARVYEL